MATDCIIIDQHSEIESLISFEDCPKLQVLNIVEGEGSKRLGWEPQPILFFKHHKVVSFTWPSNGRGGNAIITIEQIIPSGMGHHDFNVTSHT